MANKFTPTRFKESKAEGKPTINSVSYKLLMDILSLEAETSTSAHGVFIANSKVRSIRERVEHNFSVAQ